MQVRKQQLELDMDAQGLAHLLREAEAWHVLASALISYEPDFSFSTPLLQSDLFFGIIEDSCIYIRNICLGNPPQVASVHRWSQERQQGLP